MGSFQHGGRIKPDFSVLEIFNQKLFRVVERNGKWITFNHVSPISRDVKSCLDHSLQHYGHHWNVWKWCCPMDYPGWVKIFNLCDISTQTTLPAKGGFLNVIFLKKKKKSHRASKCTCLSVRGRGQNSQKNGQVSQTFLFEFNIVLYMYACKYELFVYLFLFPFVQFKVLTYLYNPYEKVMQTRAISDILYMYLW